MRTEKSSRLPGFYDLSLQDRGKIASELSLLTPDELGNITNFAGLPQHLAETFIENAIGTFSMPLGIATNFTINQREILIPMAVEESSVVAAASHGAKLVRAGGGFQTHSSDPIMTGQVQLRFRNTIPSNLEAILEANKKRLIDFLNQGQERLVKRGGGTVDLTWYRIEAIASLVVELHINTCDAMGANIVNTLCEKIAPEVSWLFPQADIGLKILTNLTENRMAYADCCIPGSAFSADKDRAQFIMQRIAEAWEFAEHDIYRATTHNKGVMNGIDPVLIATGNDWRAIEAGAHAFACKSGRYRPLTKWQVLENGYLQGSIAVPMALGTVGGVTKLHPTAQSALKILGNPDAQGLAEIVVAVGLSQNLAALRALASEGIQRGHMALHRSNTETAKEITQQQGQYS